MAGYSYDNSLPSWQNYANWVAAGSPAADASGQMVDVRGQPLNQSQGGYGGMTGVPSFQPAGVPIGAAIPAGNWSTADWNAGGAARNAYNAAGGVTVPGYQGTQGSNFTGYNQPSGYDPTKNPTIPYNPGSATAPPVSVDSFDSKTGVAKPPATTTITPVPPPPSVAGPPAGTPPPGGGGLPPSTGGNVAVDPSFNGTSVGPGNPTAAAGSGLYNTSMESGVNMADAVASVAGHHLGENAVQSGMPGQFSSGGQQATVPSTITSSDGWGSGYGVNQSGWTQYGQGQPGTPQDAGYLYKNLKTPTSVGGWLANSLGGAGGNAAL